jgi:hypothetical protein
MELREYDYISERSDTLPRGTLEATQKVLTGISSNNAQLIDKVLNGGYIESPAGWKWGGYYRVVLSKTEIKAIFDDLIKAEGLVDIGQVDSKKTLNKLKRLIACWARPLHETPETYDEYKSKQVYFDLRGMSFDSFLDLIFDHPVTDKTKKEKEWYWNLDVNRWVDWDKPHVVDLYGELFSRSEELIARYPKEKLEQGFWFMMGSSLEFSVYELLHDDELEVGLKEKLIGSMYPLYEKLYLRDTLEGCSCYMWWDSLGSEFSTPGAKGPLNYDDDRRIQDAMFSTLVRILALDSEICQLAALHGLNHLDHPDTEKAIKDFIKKNRQLTKEQIEYANRSITGDNL